MPGETARDVDALTAQALSTEKDEVMGETRAVVIIHKGYLVAEAYRDGFGPETKQVSWSMAKSITQALVGRAVHLGLIEDLDAPMPTPFDPRDPRAKISWRHWLTMTDGLDYKEINATGLADNDVVNMMYGRGKFDVLAYAEAELPLIHTPGKVWNYSTAGYHLISRALETPERIIAQEVGTFRRTPHKERWLQPNQERSFCQERTDSEGGAGAHCHWVLIRSEDFFARIPSFAEAKEPALLLSELALSLSMDAQPEFDASGTFLGGSLVWASARDFAKFGYLYLRDGVWDSARLLPRGWVDFARTDTQAENANIYGAGWWITAYGAERSHAQTAKTPPWDAFHAGGHEGQTIWVVPSKDLVIVRLGLMSNAPENWEALYEWNQQIARAFPDVIPDIVFPETMTDTD